MATRLATTRNNFITVTQVKNDDDTDTNNSSNVGNNSTEIQRTQITPVSLHHVNLSQVSLEVLELLFPEIYVEDLSEEWK